MYCRVYSLAGAMLVAGIAAAPAAAKVNVQPGLYATTSKITSVTGMGMKPAQIQNILASKPDVDRQCITAADLAKNDWYINNKEPGCSYKDASVPGRIAATAQCKGGRTQKITGSYTPTSFVVMVSGGNAEGTMAISMSGKRIGACTGNEDEE